MSPTETYSLILSIGVAGVALLLGVWQWVEKTRRGTLASAEDARHFQVQEIRRSIVALIMGTLAVGIFVGSRMETRVGGKPNLHFVEIWIGIFILVLLLLALAMFDWFATRRYAIRHRSAILQEGIEILKEEFRLRAAQEAQSREFENGNGHSSPQFP